MWMIVLGGMSACTLPTVVPEALNSDFKPTGEIVARSFTSSFDDFRVRSPMCNLSKRTDGSWGGTCAERGIDVSMYGQSVRGIDFTLHLDTSKPGVTTVTGQMYGKIYRFEFSEDKAVVRTPNVSATYSGKAVLPGVVKYGADGELELRGQAGATPVPWPQFGFALMAAFP